jgi:hypothetical protein
LVRLLVRYFRKGESLDASGGQLDAASEDLLLLHWAISPSVRNLIEYAQQNTHELQSILGSRTVVSDGAIRGRLLAAESVRLQATSANPSLYLVDEPYRSFETGPNRVLGWTLRTAARLARRFRTMLPPEATYFERSVSTLALVQQCERTLPITNDTLLRSPSADDVRSARTSRIRLYRLAAAAYETLRAIERLDIDAVADLLRATLVGPMERWRQFELALALAMADAIGDAVGAKPRISNISPGPIDVLIDIGPYAVRWQRAGPHYLTPRPERWEHLVNDILSSYGVSPGSDRPDVILYERENGNVLAVGEAKFFENDDWKDRLRDATSQVVAYARGYETTQDVQSLVSRSVIALWDTPNNQPPWGGGRAPAIVTFRALEAGLEIWAKRVVDPAHLVAS